jgi:hypothetical protein
MAEAYYFHNTNPQYCSILKAYYLCHTNRQYCNTAEAYCSIAPIGSPAVRWRHTTCASRTSSGGVVHSDPVYKHTRAHSSSDLTNQIAGGMPMCAHVIGYMFTIGK